MNTKPWTFYTSRILRSAPEEVYAAFAAPERLAAWWGPDGFSNEFHEFDFRISGAWKFDMIGPDGKRYRNENTFVDLIAGSRVVIQHESAPRFELTVELAAVPGGTSISWTQVFEDPKVAAAVRHIVEPANEQNLDRLSALLAGQAGAA